MKWTQALATGHELIDEQHRGLFHCLEELETATTEQRTLLAVYSITRLKHYVREHFETEEAVMKQCKFPKFKEHIAEHENFRTKMAALQGKAVILDVSAEMVEFLADWLINHVAESDLEYAPYLRK
ncbi:MAG: bacteriohemerythrin [Proteobacteria bacterium]|nr:bacteriohemerythrin [Pseudomonadota bacterium]